jgi:PAS domain S-box-containing protein
MKARILVVEDEFITAADIQSHLQEMGYEVPVPLDTGESAVRAAGELKPDLILMDITLNGQMTGIEAAERIWSLYRIPVIYLTAHSEQSTLDRALSSNPYGYVIKPFEASGLRACIEMALFKHGMEEELRESEQTILTLLNAVPDALVLVSRDGRITAINDAMAGRLGWPRRELKGAAMAEFIRSGRVKADMGQIERVFRERIPVSFEEEHAGRLFRTSVYPTDGPEGIIPGIAIQSQDITEIRNFEEGMKREGLLQIEENMEQFLTLNDQIRNPLQVIAGYTELVDTPVRARIEEQIRIINDLVTRLDRGWIESEKVRSFLIRHLRHGEDDVPWACGTKEA